MTFEQFQATFPVGSKLRILNREKPRHVVLIGETEKVAILKWWRNTHYGWYYEVLTETEMLVWSENIKKVK